MIFVYFIYGLAFFILGFAILFYPKRGSAFDLARDFWLIGAFGIVHSINEWINMFIIIHMGNEVLYLKIIGFVVLPVSYIFLIQFGIKIITKTKPRYSVLKILPIALSFMWIVIFLLNHNQFLIGNIFAYYLLGIPGIFLTSYGLVLKIPEFKNIKLLVVTSNLKLAAVAFFLYGILIVPEARFFPANVFNYTVFFENICIHVQIFRAMCAMIIAYSLIKILSVFDWESKSILKMDMIESRKNQEVLKERDRLVYLYKEIENIYDGIEDLILEE